MVGILRTCYQPDVCFMPRCEMLWWLSEFAYHGAKLRGTVDPPIRNYIRLVKAPIVWNVVLCTGLRQNRVSTL